jgi:hypothetical protein
MVWRIGTDARFTYEVRHNVVMDLVVDLLWEQESPVQIRAPRLAFWPLQLMQLQGFSCPGATPHREIVQGQKRHLSPAIFGRLPFRERHQAANLPVDKPPFDGDYGARDTSAFGPCTSRAHAHKREPPITRGVYATI